MPTGSLGGAMAADRLSGLDTAFLCLDHQVSPMQMGVLMIFHSDRPMSAERMVSLLTERARKLPQLRRRVQSVRFPPGAARWAEDREFRVEDHIYLHYLDGLDGCGPDGYGRAAELAADLIARPLPRDRPLWELHVMSEVGDDRFAVLLHLHHAFADGLATLEIAIGLLDDLARKGSRPTLTGVRNPDAGTDRNSPARPIRTRVARARLKARRVLCWPHRAASGVCGAAANTVGQLTDVLSIATSVMRTARLPSPGSPLVVSSSGRRGLGLARLDLQQVNRIRAHFGGTVNDVLLAVVSGALRQYLSDRGHPVDQLRLRALIPVSRRARSLGRTGANQLSGYVCELPLGEPDPGRRLGAVRTAMELAKAAGTTRGAGAVPLIADWVPSAVHRVMTPMVGQVASLLFDIMVTSAPLPRVSLRLDGAELEAILPVAPLASGQALVVALSCYRGVAYIGLHADREAFPDVQDLAAAVTASVAVLDRVAA